MRIFNITLDENKSILKELVKIYGIGRKRAKKILDMLSIDYLIPINDLTNEKKEQLKEFLISKEKTLGNALKRSISNNFKKEIVLKTYRGFRYKHKLPVRGQRTRTNAKTTRKCGILFDF